MASKWHFNDFRHVPCRQVLGRLSWPNMRNALPQIWRKRPCDKGTSVRCTCRTARKLIPSAQSLALATKRERPETDGSTQWEVKTCVHSNYVYNEWNWNMHLHIAIEGTWWNMMEHGKGWNLHKQLLVPNLWPTRNLVNTNGSACSTQLPPSSLSSGIWHMVKLRQFLHSGDLKRYCWLRFRDFSAICRSSANITR